jgi:hypothetical protein
MTNKYHSLRFPLVPRIMVDGAGILERTSKSGRNGQAAG